MNRQQIVVGVKTTHHHTTQAAATTARHLHQISVGAARVTLAAAKWVTHHDGRHVRRAALEAARELGPDAYAAANANHHRIESQRIYGTLVAVAVVGIIVVVAKPQPHPAVVAAVLTAVALGLWWAGRPKDAAPIQLPHMPGKTDSRVTRSTVSTALEVLGIKRLTDQIGDVRIDPVAAPGGDGFRLLLPPGVTVAEITRKRDTLAANLRTPGTALFLEEGRHPGEVELFVANKPLSQMRMPAWPVLDKPVSFFRPAPVAVDARGRMVDVLLYQSNAVIAGMIGSGKTNAMRLFMSIAALDPNCRIIIVNLKGGVDYAAFENLAMFYVNGKSDTELRKGLDVLRWVRDEITERNARIAASGIDEFPEGRIEEHHAKKYEWARPIAVFLDEVNEWTLSDEYRDEATELMALVTNKDRSVAIHCSIASQQSDDRSIPSQVRANLPIVAGLRMARPSDNRVTFGENATRDGIDTTRLTDDDRGCGVILGSCNGGHPMVRFFALSAGDARRVVERAGAARGGVEPRALPDVPDTDELPVTVAAEPDLLDAVLRVWRPTAGFWGTGSRATFRHLAEAVTAQPGGLVVSQRDVSDLIAGLGVPKRQIKFTDAAGAKKNLWGADLVDVEAASGRVAPPATRPATGGSGSDDAATPLPAPLPG